MRRRTPLSPKLKAGTNASPTITFCQSYFASTWNFHLPPNSNHAQCRTETTMTAASTSQLQGRHSHLYTWPNYTKRTISTRSSPQNRRMTYAAPYLRAHRPTTLERLCHVHGRHLRTQALSPSLCELLISPPSTSSNRLTATRKPTSCGNSVGSLLDCSTTALACFPRLSKGMR